MCCSASSIQHSVISRVNNIQKLEMKAEMIFHGLMMTLHVYIFCRNLCVALKYGSAYLPACWFG